MISDLKVNTLRELWQQNNELHWLPVIGVSMLPLLREGDRILVSHDLSKLRRGDILVFQQGDGLVAHRVVRLKRSQGNGYVCQTKGDNCTYFDRPLSGSDILGRVNLISHNGKEYDLTTPTWRLRSRMLASLHLFAGTAFQILRAIKHQFQK